MGGLPNPQPACQGTDPAAPHRGWPRFAVGRRIGELDGKPWGRTVALPLLHPVTMRSLTFVCPKLSLHMEDHTKPVGGAECPPGTWLGIQQTAAPRWVETGGQTSPRGEVLQNLTASLSPGGYQDPPQTDSKAQAGAYGTTTHLMSSMLGVTGKTHLEKVSDAICRCVLENRCVCQLPSSYGPKSSGGRSKPGEG